MPFGMAPCFPDAVQWAACLCTHAHGETHTPCQLWRSCSRWARLRQSHGWPGRRVGVLAVCPTILPAVTHRLVHPELTLESLRTWREGARDSPFAASPSAVRRPQVQGHLPRPPPLAPQVQPQGPTAPASCLPTWGGGSSGSWPIRRRLEYAHQSGSGPERFGQSASDVQAGLRHSQSESGPRWLGGAMAGCVPVVWPRPGFRRVQVRRPTCACSSCHGSRAGRAGERRGGREDAAVPAGCVRLEDLPGGRESQRAGCRRASAPGAGTSSRRHLLTCPAGLGGRFL